MAEKRTKTSIVVDQQRWRDFGAELRRRGIDYSEGVEFLIDRFIQGGFANDLVPIERDSHSLFRPENRRHHTILEIILQGADPVTRDAIMMNLTAFAFTHTVAREMTYEQIIRAVDLLIDSFNQQAEPGRKHSQKIHKPKKGT